MSGRATYSVTFPRVCCGSCKGTGAEHIWSGHRLKRVAPWHYCKACLGLGSMPEQATAAPLVVKKALPSAFDDRTVRHGFACFEAYAFRHGLGRPVAVSCNRKSGWRIACAWSEDKRTSIWVGPDYRREAKEIERRCREWMVS